VKRLAHRLLALLLAIAPLGARAADAPTVDDLLAAGRLQLDSALRPADGIVPGQKLGLVLQVATDRWFTGGTRIVIPEVPGLVILQTEQFASNASENRGGESWVIQRWTLDVYARRAGEFSIPAIALDLQVNAGERGEVAGRVNAPPVTFEARLPDGLAGAESWVAAPEFRVSQRFDRDLDALQVGDAFEREITFEATDLMAMMLPTFEAARPEGLAIYPEPPVLDDSSNRGELRARRSQRFSYVVESEGLYLLPARDFLWWNTQTRELQVLSLPATEVLVASGAASDAGTGTGPGFSQLTARQRALLLAGLAALGATLWLAFLLLPRLPLERVGSWLRRVSRVVAELREPALPAELNPGSSAGGRKASG
jgi:hypothetical protein